MESKFLKLLVLFVAILSLFFFSSCEEASKKPETGLENNEEETEEDGEGHYKYEVQIEGSTFVINDGFISLLKNSEYDENINIPEKINNVSIIGIADNAFYGCDKIKTISIPNGVTSIGYDAFSWCRFLTSVTIPEGVTSIGDRAFCNCFNLASITIPDSVTSIGNVAFLGCDFLTSVTIPEGVTSIGDSAFDCSGLTSIYVDENNQNYFSVEGVLFDKNKINLIQYPIGRKDTEYTIPSSVTSIGKRAFSNCKSLTSVTIPEGVTSIGDRAFSNCDSLTSVTIPGSVTSIGDSAFYSCKNLDIYIKKDSNSIANAPWGADNAKINWNAE